MICETSLNKFRAYQFLQNYPTFERLSDVHEDDEMLQMAVATLFGPDGLAEALPLSKRVLLRRADALFAAPAL